MQTNPLNISNYVTMNINSLTHITSQTNALNLFIILSVVNKFLVLQLVRDHVHHS